MASDTFLSMWGHSLSFLFFFLVLVTLPGTVGDSGVQKGTGLGWVAVAVWEAGDHPDVAVEFSSLSMTWPFAF